MRSWSTITSVSKNWRCCDRAVTSFVVVRFERDPRLLGHVMHERGRAVRHRVVAAEEGWSWCGRPRRCAGPPPPHHRRDRDGTQIEEGTDELVAGVVQLGAPRRLHAVKNHGLENEQGLEHGVELQVVADLVEMSGRARVITLEVLLRGEGKRPI